METRRAVALRHFPSMWCIRNYSNNQPINFTNNPILTEIISMETLSEEFKPIASENCEFESRQNRNTNWNFSHVQPINIPI